jgi:ribosomal protein S18 acetylase RimI-like enzyme
MEIENSSELILANFNDKPLIVKILTDTFKNDPCLNWLVENVSNKNKLKVIVNYVVDETLCTGQIYLTNDKKAVVLWKNENQEKFSFQFVKRNISFLFQMGIKCVIKNLKMGNISHAHFPKKTHYYYLYMIGVLNEVQGKGLASKLMNPILEISKLKNLPVFLETANPTNVEIYKKKGFVIIDTFMEQNILINYMRFN